MAELSLGHVLPSLTQSSLLFPDLLAMGSNSVVEVTPTLLVRLPPSLFSSVWVRDREAGRERDGK